MVRQPLAALNDFHVYGASTVPDGPDKFVATNRAELLPYLAARHAQHEELQLVQLKYGTSWARDRVDLSMTLTRRTDDVPEHMIPAKGDFVCSTHQFVVWNMEGWGRGPSFKGGRLRLPVP